MRILFIIYSLRRGGKERRLIQLLQYLKKLDGIECQLILFSNDIYYEEVYDLDIKIYKILKKKNDLTLFYKIFKVIKKFKPCIVHTWGSQQTFYCIPSILFSNAKLINGMITNAPPVIKPFSRQWLIYKITYIFSKYIISNSHAGIKSYKVHKKGIVIHNGFDFARTENIVPENIVKARYQITNDKVVGMVANQSEQKDYMTYLKAATSILTKRNDVFFFCIGDFYGHDQIFKNSLDAEFKSKIIFTGRINDVESLINIFDVGVLSTHYEGISNAIIEYMAMRKPVVATDCSGNCEILENGKSGFLVKENSAIEMENKILFLLENNKIALKMGAYGRKYIEEEYTIEKMSQKYLKLYASTLLASSKI